MTGRPIRLILDASAVTAFTRSSVHVGEVLEQVADEGATFAVLSMCLSEAAAAASDDEMRLIRLLASTSQCRQAQLEAGWLEWVTAAQVYGSATRAATAIVAIQRRVYVVTAEPDAYGKRVPTIRVW